MFKRGEKFQFEISEYAFGGKGISKLRRTNKEQLFSSPIRSLDKKLKPSFQQKRRNTQKPDSDGIREITYRKSK